MIKVMVVDDEALILEKIVYLLDNSPIEFESFAVAGNGQEALQLMDGGNVPDIVLTDIRMPIIDGLELIERTSTAYPTVRFVVISGYAEFEYAVKAMQFGVTGYVLKPVKANELLKVVEQIRDEIIAERQRAEYTKLSETVNLENKRVVFENKLFGWLINRHSDAETRMEIEQESDVLNCRCYSVAVFMLHTSQDGAKRLIVTEMRSILDSQSNKSWILENPLVKDAFAVIFGGSSEGELEQATVGASKRIYRRLQETFGINVTVGLGDPGDLRASYRSGVIALKKRFHFGTGGIYDGRSIPQSRVDVTPQSLVLKTKLAEQSLENKSVIRAKVLLLEFAKETFIDRIADYLGETSIDHLFNEYVNIVIRYCLKNNIEFLEKIDQEVYSGKALDGLDDNHALVNLISSMLDRVFAEVEGRKALNGSDKLSVIDSIIHYIDRNIHEEVALQTISEKFFVNPSYLSRVFKATTGQGFVKYVTGRKIDKAKELLENGVMDIADIAHGLGFSDQQYFNRVYKKITGYTPNEWRMKRKKSSKNT